MQHIIQLSLSLVILIIPSCNLHKNYESQLISQAESIKKLPVSRQQITKVFGLEEIKSKVLPEPTNELKNSINFKNVVEVWELANGYHLGAKANTDLIVSAESRRKEKEWKKTVRGRDFFILEFDPIHYFKEFRLVTPKGKEIYSSKKSTTQ